MTLRYKRILLKLSGEMLAGNQRFGIQVQAIQFLAREIANVYREGVEIALVPGGGNILRGAQASMRGMDRVTADYVGMLATLINSLNLVDALRSLKVEAEVLNAFPVGGIAEVYNPERAILGLRERKVVVLAGGTGNPMLSTDTTAALRARELSCQIVLKGTKVDGIYDADPEKVKNARYFHTLSYRKVINQRLKVMDLTAVALLEEGGIPIRVFNLRKAGNLLRIVSGESIGTLVK